MSKTIISVFVLLLAQILPLIGVEIGSEQLTQVAQTVLTIVSGVVIYFSRLSNGDVTPVGARK